MKLTEHFSYEELTASQTAKAKRISNTPDPESAANLAILAIRVLEPAREQYGAPIRISSGYRSKRLNSVLPGASSTSQHMKGQAADLECDDLDKLYGILQQMDVDQLLFEYDSKGTRWIHVSYNPEGNRNDKRSRFKANR